MTEQTTTQNQKLPSMETFYLLIGQQKTLHDISTVEYQRIDP
jgi:hypothetical protein